VCSVSEAHGLAEAFTRGLLGGFHADMPFFHNPTSAALSFSLITLMKPLKKGVSSYYKAIRKNCGEFLFLDEQSDLESWSVYV